MFLELHKGSRPESDGFTEHEAEENLSVLLKGGSGLSAQEEWQAKISKTVAAAHGELE